MALHLKNSSLSLLIVQMMILSLHFLASAQTIMRPSSVSGKTGTATFTDDLTGKEAGADKSLFDAGARLDQHFMVSCIGGSDPNDSPCTNTPAVKVKITESCGGDNCGTFNLSKDAFSFIADPVAGVINISFFPMD